MIFFELTFDRLFDGITEFATLLLQGDIFVYIHVAVPCLKIAISKTLGYGIVVGSAMSEFLKKYIVFTKTSYIMT